MKNKKFLILLGLVMSVMAGGAIGYLGSASTIDKQAAADRKKPETEEKRGGQADEGKESTGNEKGVRLDEAMMKEFGVEVGTAAPGVLASQLEIPGEIVPNADRLVKVVPSVAGVVTTVAKSLGDTVQKGEILAIIDSRELTDAKSAYLGATKKLGITKTTLQREEELWKKKISPEQDYLDAKRGSDEAQIELSASQQKLMALGLSAQEVTSLPAQKDVLLSKYELKAPFAGTIIEKRVTVGDALKDDAVAFVVADLSTVWVSFNIQQKDFAAVKPGQQVSFFSKNLPSDIQGTLSYVDPLVGQDTRTLVARAVLPNETGLFRPGLFVTARLTIDEVKAPLVIPVTALITDEGKKSVFVKTGEEFRPQAVTIGRSNEKQVEVTAGLEAGQQYAAKGVLTLKAQLSKGAFGDGHNH
jgi:cobalt-zinc-cadmium efflux system membrane fusion protein